MLHNISHAAFFKYKKPKRQKIKFINTISAHLDSRYQNILVDKVRKTKQYTYMQNTRINIRSKLAEQREERNQACGI